jgi:hypothetical protein
VVLKPTNRLGRKEPNVIIIGCDYHPGFQQIAYVNSDTGELSEARLGHKQEANSNHDRSWRSKRWLDRTDFLTGND